MTASRTILVVEDDEAIRELLRQQLTSLGFVADLAADGNEGYSLWKANRYDLVLTDCSMPAMSGFELASKIRCSDSAVPIVAITGHAEPDGGTASLGINDFIKKPFAAAHLRQVLGRWLVESEPEPSGRLRKPPPASTDSSVLCRAGIDDPAMIRKLVDTFIKTIPSYLQTLDRALATGTLADIAAAAHKLKSAAHLMGGAEVARLCGILEEAAADNDKKKIIRLVRQIEIEVLALGESLKAAMRSGLAT